MLAPNEISAYTGIRGLVANAVADITQDGEEALIPLAERDYSGKVLLRLPPARHRKLAVRAAEQGIYMDRLINDALADA